MTDRKMDVMFSSKTDLWSTPQDFFDTVSKEFPFSLDVCALPENAKCKKFFSPQTSRENGNSFETVSKKSKTTYADWCKKNGFPYAKGTVPEEWLEHRPKARQKKALSVFLQESYG